LAYACIVRLYPQDIKDATVISRRGIHGNSVINRRGIHDGKPDGATAIQTRQVDSHTLITGTFRPPFSLPEANDPGLCLPYVAVPAYNGFVINFSSIDISNMIFSGSVEPMSHLFDKVQPHLNERQLKHNHFPEPLRKFSQEVQFMLMSQS
jgi:hypothetical protein